MKSERTNHVAPETIDAREPREPQAEEQLVRVQTELADLRARIAAAALVQPLPHELHCRDCFNKGRNAAILALAG